MTTPLEVIRRDGWCRNDWENNEGQHCLHGAIIVAYGDMSTKVFSSLPTVQQTAFERIAHEMIVEQFPERLPEGWITPFNDHPDTTQADVELVLEKAQIIYAERVQDVSGAI